MLTMISICDENDDDDDDVMLFCEVKCEIHKKKTGNLNVSEQRKV